MARREAFLAEIMAIDPSRLVFLDESGSNIAMTRKYGRCLRGERIVERVPRNRSTVTTMLGALARDGLRALMTNDTLARPRLAGAMNSGHGRPTRRF